jgi:hypothetical protein
MTTRPHRCTEVTGNIYCCWCGYRGEGPEAFTLHVESEREKLREPYCITTILSVDHSPPCGIEIRSTPKADAAGAVAVVMVLPERSPSGRVLHGHYRHHEVLIAKSSLDFLVEAISKHRHAVPNKPEEPEEKTR